MNFLENQMAQNIANRIAIEKSMGKDFTPEDCLDLIEKAGRGAPLGEVRTWNGKEYIKTPKGWRPKPKGYKETPAKENESKETKPGNEEKPKDLLSQRKEISLDIKELRSMEKRMESLEDLMYDEEEGDVSADAQEYEAEYDEISDKFDKLARKTKIKIKKFLKDANLSSGVPRGSDLADLISAFKKVGR